MSCEETSVQRCFPDRSTPNQPIGRHQDPLNLTEACVVPDAEDDGVDFLFPVSQHEEVPGPTNSASDQSACSLSRPTGLKRIAASCVETTTGRKRLYKGPSHPPDKINIQTIQQLDPNVTIDKAKAILHDYNSAIRILRLTNTSVDNATPTLEYMIKLINDWQPKRDIICMYIRWSKRLRRNYHLDSISTLLCVATQCDYTPHVFLKNIKTLTVCSSTTTYCLNFKFVTSKNKAIDGNLLSEKFLGLSVTLRLLQRGIVDSVGTFGSVGLKTVQGQQSPCSNQINMAFSPADKKKITVANQPTSKFHTNSGLIGRIWLAIQHRWIAMQVVEMLFPSHLAVAKTEQESLAFSFQMHSSAGPSRFDFLDPLIGICFRFRSTTIIDNHDEILRSVWEKPSSFVAFGNGYLEGTPEKDRVQYIAETFKFLQSLMHSCRKVTLHLKTKRETRWQMIRGYAFHFWLDRVSNQKMKGRVHQLCTGSDPPTKQQRKLPSATTADQGNQLTTPKLRTSAFDSTTKKKCRTHNTAATTTNVESESGLTQLLTTRRGNEDLSKRQQPAMCPNPEYSQNDTSARDSGLHTASLFDPTSLVWTSARLATRSALSSRVTSQLLIHNDDGGYDITADLSSLEVYSANLLHKLRHSRRTGPTGCHPQPVLGKPTMSIGSDIDKFVDRSTKVFHVAREDSNYFREHGHLVPSIQDIANLCKAVTIYGKTDMTRCPQQHRVNIGCGGQHRPQGVPETLVGMSFEKNLASDNELSADDIKSTIGRMTEFTWNVMNDMQADAKDGRLAPDRVRNKAYASHLSKYLQMNDDVSFEDVTVVVGILYPVMPNVAEHIDQMNDTVAGYTRTGVFNLVLALEDTTTREVLLHVQVMCNFRRVIREYILPFHSLLQDVTENCTTYLAKWQQNMNEIYGGKSEIVPTPFDRIPFFVDDCLPFQTINISNGSRESRAITGEYLLTEISPSRVLSFSLFIDPIVDLNGVLCYDQRIELCFVASVLSNPFWFEHTITSLTQKHLNPTNQFCFGLHPLHDWAKETVSMFGAWQGGPHNRWSPFGGDTPFPSLFGAHTNATELEKEHGATKLKAVIQILYHHIQWVNSLCKFESNVVHDLSLSMIENHMTYVTDAIFSIVPCQFSVFRLYVFTTIAAGTGLIKPGVHLKALSYPVKGSASFKHLTNPRPDNLTRTQALSLCLRQGELSSICDNKNQGILPQRHDQLMLYLSYEMGQTSYCRDETECVLCEAHPNRNLKCRDWFKKGRRIYDLNRLGRIVQREYGMNTKWIELERESAMRFAYLKEIVLYKGNDEILKEYSTVFGELLQKNKSFIKFCGRNTRTSDCIQQYDNEYITEKSKHFCGIQHRAANFYNGDYTKRMNLTTIQVLGDREMPVEIESAQCNDITGYPDGHRLWKRVLHMVYGDVHEQMMHSARYHQQLEESTHVSKTVVFPGHLDKAFVVNAVFVPLSTRDFFTVIAVPASWHVGVNESSEKRFQGWIERLPSDEKQLVEDYLQKFKITAELYMKVKVDVHVYLCSAGSLLVFPANTCFHATITPGTSTPNSKLPPRDLFIIHTTISTKR